LHSKLFRMNRIILIGNGFDLAHDLKTSYKHFIDDYWKNKIDKVNDAINKNQAEFSDDDIYFNINNSVQLQKNPVTFDGLMEFLDLRNFYASQYKIGKGFANTFLQDITAKMESLENWVDIEEEYNRLLNRLVIEENKKRSSNNNKSLDLLNNNGQIKILNKGLKILKEALEKYLSNVTSNNTEKKANILQNIYSEFELDDFTEKGKESVIKEQYSKILFYLEKYDKKELSSADVSERTINFLRKIDIQCKRDEYSIKRLFVKESSSCHLLPSQMLFLNFNYTATEAVYYNHDTFEGTKNGYRKEFKIDKETIHIHGEVENKDNPIIFGYGDETGEEYVAMEKLNENEYLEHVKSIKYLETDNYKKMMHFIDSDLYQIFIFGHSCGISDRTLLKKLFENENCVSIKPFYCIDENKKEENKDNYSDIVRNISRNFENKTLMREKVVNKKYCQAFSIIPLKDKNLLI